MNEPLTYAKAVALSQLTNDIDDLIKKGWDILLEATGGKADADPNKGKRLSAVFALRAVFAVDSPFTTDAHRQQAVRDVLARYLGGLDTVDPAKITEALDMYVPKVMQEWAENAAQEEKSIREEPPNRTTPVT